MRSKIFIFASLILLMGVGYLLWQYEPTANIFRTETKITPATIDNPEELAVFPEETSERIIREPSSTDRQVYINQTWRFSFELPKGAAVRDPEAGSAVALANIGILPEGQKGISPVYVFVSPKWWVDRLLDKKEGNISIGGYDGWYYQSVTMSVIPNMLYSALVNDEYWITLGIQNEYLEDFGMILDTFEFHNPPTLEELGIDPNNPPGTKNGVSSQPL